MHSLRSALAAPRPRRSAPIPETNVEMTCTREVGHVYYSVPPEAVSLLVGVVCPTCHIGMLAVAAESSEPARFRRAS